MGVGSKAKDTRPNAAFLGRGVLTAGLCSALMVVLGSGAALAQATSLAEGIEAYENGDFAGAAELLAAAEANEAMSRVDFVRMVAHQVLVAQAMSNDDALEAGLLRLATLDPEALEGQASPVLISRLDAVVERVQGQRIRLDVHVERQGGLSLDARVAGDVAGLVEDVTLETREQGGEWRPHPGGSASFEDEVGEIEYRAIALSAGGSVLARVDSRTRPEAPNEATPEVNRRPRRVAIAVVAVLVLAGAGVGLGLALRDRGDVGFSGPPVVSW